MYRQFVEEHIQQLDKQIETLETRLSHVEQRLIHLERAVDILVDKSEFLVSVFSSAKGVLVFIKWLAGVGAALMAIFSFFDGNHGRD